MRRPYPAWGRRSKRRTLRPRKNRDGDSAESRRPPISRSFRPLSALQRRTPVAESSEPPADFPPSALPPIVVDGDAAAIEVNPYASPQTDAPVVRLGAGGGREVWG